MYAMAIWQFFLDDLHAGKVWLIIRQRLVYCQNTSVTWRLVEPFKFEMERKMMPGIKQRPRQPEEDCRDREDL